MQLRPEQAQAFGPDPCVPCQGAAREPRTSEPAATPSGESVVTVEETAEGWLVIELCDDEGTPMKGERYLVELPDGRSIDGSLDDSGKARIEGIEPGSCKVTFPSLAAEEWRRA